MADVFDFDATLDQPGIPIGVPTDIKCQLRLQSSPSFVPPQTQKAMTTNICLVFDCSGSMAGKKRETAIEAAKMIVSTVHERHRLSLVGFATKAKVLVDNAQPTADVREALEKKIEKEIRGFERGTTNLADGLKKAAKVLEKEKADAKVMVILSDGGADSPKDAQVAGMAATDSGMQLFAVGIGEEYEADRLLKLVTPSNGAVFGETDLAKIKATFEILIGRIESFVATNVELVATLAAGVIPGNAYKTNPEQAFIGPIAIDSQRRAFFHVGNIERNQTYAFLLSLTAPALKAGKLELARASLVYDVPSLKVKGHEQQLRVSVEYTKNPPVPNAEIMETFRRAQFVELAEGLADAQRKNDKERSTKILEQLIARAREQEDAEAEMFYEDLLAELKERGKISQERINALVLGTTVMRRAKKGARLYDVVLLDAGKSIIQVIREIREVTGFDLRKVSDLVKAAPAPIQESMSFADARALKKRIQASGARVDVRARD